MPQKHTLAILAGGGPAPGINGVIATVTIEAINKEENNMPTTKYADNEERDKNRWEELIDIPVEQRTLEQWRELDRLNKLALEYEHHDYLKCYGEFIPAREDGKMPTYNEIEDGYRDKDRNITTHSDIEFWAYQNHRTVEEANEDMLNCSAVGYNQTQAAKPEDEIPEPVNIYQRMKALIDESSKHKRVKGQEHKASFEVPDLMRFIKSAAQLTAFSFAHLDSSTIEPHAYAMLRNIHDMLIAVEAAQASESEMEE